MVFSSTIFLFAFLPAFLLVYFLLPRRGAKNVWLLAASLLFYAWGEPVYVLLMMASIIVNWLFGLAVGSNETPPPDAGFCSSRPWFSTASSSGSSSTRAS